MRGPAVRAVVAIVLGTCVSARGELHAQVVDTTLVADTALALDSLATADPLAPDTLLQDRPAADALARAADPLAADTLGDDPSPGVPYGGPLPPEAATQLGYVIRAYPEAPRGVGLIDAGMAEARVAMEHVALAGRDSTDLSGMTRHMAHVLHAIDPVEVGSGPGAGYGFRRAARGVAAHAEQLAEMREVPGVVTFHAPHAVRAARGAVLQADDAIDLARQVQRATSAAAARGLLRRLADAVRWMAYGGDRDGDGRIGHTEAESGLAQARYHLALVERVTSR